MKKIIDVRIDNISRNEARSKVGDILKKDEQDMVYTPNPEMLVDANSDEYFQNVLNDSSLNICDSKGLQFACGFGTERIPGVDFMQDVCEIAEKRGQSIYLLGSGDIEVLEKLEKNLKDKYPDLEIAGSHPGPEINLKKIENINKIELDTEKNDDIVHDIIMKAPDVIFVAFGHLKQELWIHAYIKEMPSIKLAMGVGGSFDYLSGKVDRAPKWVRHLGFEWFYRLYKQPWRIKRILKALFIFPLLFIFDKFKSFFK